MRKNILILAHNDATQFIDICNQYANLFAKDQFKVTVAYLSGKPHEKTFERTHAEEVLFLNYSKNSIRNFKFSAIKKLIQLCKERNFTIVICHRYKPTYILLWASLFVKIPVIFFVMHAMKTMHYLSRRLLIAALWRDNMYFVGVSNAVQHDLQQQLKNVSENHIITLPNCIDIAMTELEMLSREEARAFFHLPKDAFVFGTLGRLAPEKDHKNLLIAFARIKPHVTHAKLLIIGDGPLEAELKKLATELQIAEDVIFAGFLPQGFRYLKALDIFLLVSTKEAFGRVLLEAMVAKLPIIGTRTNGIPEVISGSGILVEPSNPAALTMAMLRCTEFDKNEIGEWQEKIYQHVHDKFSNEKFHDVFWRTWLIRKLNML